MILWTPVPEEQILAGYDENIYPEHETGEVAGIPVLFEKIGDGKRRVLKVNSSNPSHYLDPNVYPGLIV